MMEVDYQLRRRVVCRFFLVCSSYLPTMVDYRPRRSVFCSLPGIAFNVLYLEDALQSIPRREDVTPILGSVSQFGAGEEGLSSSHWLFHLSLLPRPFNWTIRPSTIRFIRTCSKKIWSRRSIMAATANTKDVIPSGV